MIKEISNKIKVYNIFFIYFIFFFHCDARFYIFLVEPLSYIIGSIGLSFFFMISGYFMFAGMRDDNAVKRSLKRIKTLFLPYIFWNLVFYIYFVIRDPYMRKTPLKTVLFRFAFQPYNDVLWYMSTLFIFSIVAFLLYKIIKNKVVAFVFLAAISIVLVIVCVINQAWMVENLKLGWWITKITPYIPMYLFGGIAGLHYKEKIKEPEAKWVWPLFFVLSCGLILFKYKFDEVPICYWLSMFFGPIIMWFGLPDKWFKDNKIIDFLCEPSFLIYEFQLMSFWIFQAIYKNFGFTDKQRELLIWFSALVFIYAVYYISKKFTPHLLGIATGFRSGSEFKKKVIKEK